MPSQNERRIEFTQRYIVALILILKSVREETEYNPSNQGRSAFLKRKKEKISSHPGRDSQDKKEEGRGGSYISPVFKRLADQKMLLLKKRKEEEGSWLAEPSRYSSSGK